MDSASIFAYLGTIKRLLYWARIGSLLILSNSEREKKMRKKMRTWVLLYNFEKAVDVILLCDHIVFEIPSVNCFRPA